jgi:hypothetical protein
MTSFVLDLSRVTIAEHTFALNPASPSANDSPATPMLTPLLPATILIHVDGLVINRDTGEIYGYDDKSSAYAGRIDYQHELNACRSVDDLNALLKLVDRRKLPQHTLHCLTDAQDHAHGEWRRTGTDCRITIPMTRILTKLHELVLYRNVIIITQADLAKSLGTVESNLMKKLKPLIDSNMVRVSTSRVGSGDIRKGEIKLTINPRLIFRGGDYRQEQYIEDWYYPAGYLHTGALRPFNADDSVVIAT